MFKIQEQGKPETAIWLNKLETLLSTDGNPDIPLTKAYMQEMICSVKISSTDNEKLFITDLTFNQDISINEELIAKGARAELHHGDILLIGQNVFEIFNPSIALKRLTQKDTPDIRWKLIGVSNWLDGQEFEVKGKAILGRERSCDISIPGSQLSRRHAEIFANGDTLFVKDLDSANGSFLNGQAFIEANARDGDELRFDQLTFTVEAPKVYTNKHEDNPARLDTNADAEQSSPTSPPSNNKQWVTKPTSVGNQVTDADIRLHKHQQQQKITYGIFGTVIITAIIGTIAWQFFF